MRIIETCPREIGFVLWGHCQNLLDALRTCLVILLLFCCLLIFFKINFFENSFRKPSVSNSLHIAMSNSLHLVRPDLGSNCLQRLTADDTSRQSVNHFDTDIEDASSWRYMFMCFRM